jgi:hypothetical protein
MGSPHAEVYLASPLTVAASAVAGHLESADNLGADNLNADNLNADNLSADNL